MGYLIIAIIVVVIILGNIFEWFGKITKQMSVNTRKDIIERNEDIIQQYLNEIYTGGRSYYIENKVRDCISKIAQKEGRDDLVPQYREWLSKWETRSDIPQEYIKLKNHLKKNFTKRYESLVTKQKTEQERKEKQEAEQLEKSVQNIFEKNKDLIDKFLQIAERKVAVVDDYGDENWDALPKEINICLVKIAKCEGTDANNIKEFMKNGDAWTIGKEYVLLEKKLDKVFRDYHTAQMEKPAKNIELKNLSGIEFETWVAKVLKENGFTDVRGTSKTGDQGADLIAKKDGKTIIIQTKRYQGAVGNRAVQEAISAVQFYRGDEGWVITNSSFTPSARALAHRSNIKLIDGKMLENIDEHLI